MKAKLLSAILALSVFLSGCSLFEGQFHRVTPHPLEPDQRDPEAYSARKYEELRIILGNLVGAGAETGIIYTDGYDPEKLEPDLNKAIKIASLMDPICAYAAQSIEYELGSNNGKTAAGITITYRRSPEEIQQMPRVQTLEDARLKILDAVSAGDPRLALYIESYQKTDFTQVVRDLAMNNPQRVMESPLVQESLYGEGSSRVIELLFTYETDRDDMRRMQSQVRPIFDAASLYVMGEDSDHQKFSQLYAFLMERSDYTIETSITPAYSLLRHGVGDSRAFATVYAAMCRDAGLECQTVIGTRMGEPWVWNIVCDDGNYYHVDLLRCQEESGVFQEKTDTQMTGYVWDYSVYPECPDIPVETDLPAAETEETISEEDEKKA